jgi:hypothetical protein
MLIKFTGLLYLQNIISDKLSNSFLLLSGDVLLSKELGGT